MIFSVIKKITPVLLILLMPPIIAVCLNFSWSPSTLNDTSRYLYLFTVSVGYPWGILTSVILFLFCCVSLRQLTLINVIRFMTILIAALLIGQGIKSIVKNYTAEARPYVTQIEQSCSADYVDFYSLSTNERHDMISLYVKNTPQIPKWLAAHWQTEMGYSFPSGHTLFASSWVFLVVLFIGFKRYLVATSFIIGWGIFVEISRLVLGMHHPIDLIVSNMIACVIASLAYFCANRWHIVE